MAQTYSSKGKVFLTQHQFDSRKDAGTLQTGVEYMIIDDPNTIELSDGSISLLASNGVMIIGKSAEEPYLTIGTGNQVLVDTPTVDKQVANKLYVDDALANKQDTITSTNNLLDIGLHSVNNSYIDDRSGTINIVAPGVEIDSVSETGEIRVQGAYNSETEKATTIKVHNQVYGLSINTTNIELGAYSTDGTITPYLTIGTGNQVLVDTPTVERQVANKKYVDDLVGAKQNKLSTTAPIQITEDNHIGLNYDTETLSVAENKLSVKAEGLVGWGLSASSNKLNVNKDTIGSDLAGTGLNYDNHKLHVAYGDGLQYNGTTQKLEVNFYTVANTIAGHGLSPNGTNGKIESDTYTTTTSGQRYFSSGYLTTLRAKINGSNACRIKFRESANANINDTLWIELTYCDGYAWGMTVESSNGSTEYFNYNYSSLKVDTDKYEIVDINGSTFESSAQEAFITETKVR